MRTVTVQEIDFDTAVSFNDRYRRSMVCILRGENVNKIKGDCSTARRLHNGYPVSFNAVNKLIHKQFEGMEYIDFWTNLKIYRVVEG